MNRNFTEEKTQKTRKNKKKHSTSVLIRKMQIKIKMI